MRLAAAALLALTLGLPARAEEGQPVFTAFPYEKQGPFVTAPARFLATPIYQLGFMTGALVCLPVSLIQDPYAIGNVPHDKEASLVCGRGLGTALGWPVYAAIGLPLFTLKQLFWDGPRAIAGLGRSKPGAAPAAAPEK